MRDHQKELAQANVRVCIVTFDHIPLAQAYVEQTEIEWPLLIDADRELYAAYGMPRGSWCSILSPLSIAKYIGLMLRGHRLEKSGMDYRLMGGNVLIDPKGTIQMHYVSQNPHDRPSIKQIFDAVKAAEPS